ncbi:hypothetical protein [Paenibacillus gansuensis]|uniref:Uncharacterized protein n=1 Tax=Paenibacillus gansuensis TaxID=306542 RepID=A0ABW5P7F5_9BACL
MFIAYRFPMRFLLILMLQLSLLAAADLILPLSPAEASAWVQVSDTTRTRLNEMISSAAPADAEKLRTLFGETEILLAQKSELESFNYQLHRDSGQALTALRKEIRAVDAPLITQWEAQVASAKAQAKPLLDAYYASYQQWKQARADKHKDRTAYHKAAMDRMKAPVAQAKQDIRSKQEILKNVRAAAYQKIKHLRAMIAETQGPYKQIGVERAVINSTSKQIPDQTKYLNASAKSKNLSSTLHALRTLNSLLGIMLAKQEAILQQEQAIASIVQRVRQQLAR